MNQTADAIRKQHVDFARFDQGSHFAGAPDWMAHGLSGAISARPVVWLAIYGL